MLVELYEILIHLALFLSVTQKAIHRYIQMGSILNSGTYIVRYPKTKQPGCKKGAAKKSRINLTHMYL